jgi:hypothetical protein
LQIFIRQYQNPTPTPEECPLFLYVVAVTLAFASIGVAAFLLKKRRQQRKTELRVECYKLADRKKGIRGRRLHFKAGYSQHTSPSKHQRLLCFFPKIQS